MYQLIDSANGLSLTNTQNPRELPVRVDFNDKSLLHRAKYLLNSKDGLVKAIHQKTPLNILDATAGLGNDAFLLAWLGHQVTLVERSKPIAQLLEDGLKRASNSELSEVVQRMQLVQQDSILFLQNSEALYDVIYCDPMFPESKKSRLVRKSMRALSHMVGMDYDADQLLSIALQKARKKVVVKRPRLSHPIGKAPNHSYEYQACRFDVYITNLKD